MKKLDIIIYTIVLNIGLFIGAFITNDIDLKSHLYLSVGAIIMGIWIYDYYEKYRSKK